MKLNAIVGAVAVLAAGSLVLAPATTRPGGFAADAAPAIPSVAVGPQYDTTHVYVTPGMAGAFTTSWEATFGGTNTTPVQTDVTPTASETTSELILSPVGTLSVFDFTTPVPYPFGIERGGWLTTDLNTGVSAARAAGADVTVTPFDDPIGKDAVIEFPGGVHVQLYWHTTAPHYAALATIPENRVYVSGYALTAFLRSYLAFTHGHVTSDDSHADGAAIDLPNTTYHQIAVDSPFGKTLVIATDGHLPYPFGREITGYQVADLAATLAKARAAGANVLYGPVTANGRETAVAEFPGGYIAEIHSNTGR